MSDSLPKQATRRFLVVLAACLAGSLWIAACDHEAGHSLHASGELQLDHGRKWTADESTRRSAAGMIEAVSRDPEPSRGAYQALGAELARRNRELIEGCTMQGPAHENLHVFLGHYMAAIASLENADSVEEGRRALGEVREQLALYQEHFE